jgi:Ca-activated chloride channel family protein
MSEVRAKIRGIRAEGTTNMAKGLEMALHEVAKNLDPESVNRIVLLGDGVPNDESQIPALSQTAVASGISITALGLGPDYNETLMGKVAQVTGGRFQYVEDSGRVSSFFKEEIGRLEKTYARDAWLEIAAGPGVTIENVIGQETVREANGAVRVHVGDFALGEKMDVIAKVLIGARKDNTPVELVDAVLRYTEGTGGTQVERRVFVGIHTTGDPQKLTQGLDAHVFELAKGAQRAADKLEEIRRARESDVPKGSPAPPLASAPGSRAGALKTQHDDAMQTLQRH